jgi:serine/threonine-protein kinase
VASSEPAGHELKPGDRLGPFRLESRLGEGGMGLVFKAVRDPGGEVVALKVLRPELCHDETYRKRFIHEARAASEVRQKHLVPVLDAGEADGWNYLAAAYVGGRALDERIKSEGMLPVDDVVRVTADVAVGLDALHDADLIHRDIKPSNIMLDEEGRAALTDFGLAKGRGYTVLTKPGQVMGTLDYLAPELIKGQRAAPASDIYALGCVVFECIAGRAPFADRSVFQVGLAHMESPPPDPAKASGRTDLPEELPKAVLWALEKSPDERPPTAIAYARMLGLIAGRPSVS